MPRRRSRSTSPARRAGSPFLSTAGGGPVRYGRRRRNTGARVLAVASLLAVAGAVVAGVVVWRSHVDATNARRDAAQRFVRAWAARDLEAMWKTLTPAAQQQHPHSAFLAAYRRSDSASTVRAVQVGRIAPERKGTIAVPVRVVTRDFGTLAGTVSLPVSGSSSAAVGWDPSLRLPGLRRGEEVRRRSGTSPARASILAADGTRLNATPLGTAIVGHGPPGPTGLERQFNDRLAGHPAERLLFGQRVIAQVPIVHGRSVRTTLEPRLIQAAAAALGSKLGGVAVIRPRDGAVLALAGLAVSAPQPPGSTFKIITTSAALEHGVATPNTRFPVSTSATLSGVKLGNAHGESCGGTLTQAFIQSCNSVFAPLGAKVGAKRLVAAAHAFGFGERPPIPAAKASTIAPASQLRDNLAVGAAAIGQDRDLATPLQMASAAATIGTGGMRSRPRISTLTPLVRRRAVSAKAARQVRTMMIGVVQSGTGTSAALPGVQVAGKTGTAELRPNSTNPKDADAWFAAFAPAGNPRVAVGVMLVGAGFGGTAAAPIARQVLAAALR